MISSISLRWPPKTCGLFDTGFAGGSDVTSSDFGVLTAVDQSSLYSLEDIQPFNMQDSVMAPHKPSSTMAEKESNVAPFVADMDFPADMLDPLGGLEDPLADTSLDAFVNLDNFFMGDTFFDECDAAAVAAEAASSTAPFEDDLPDLAEVKPVIDFLEAEPSEKPAGKVSGKKNRKRKSGKANQPVKTSLFEILDSSAADHDYTSKYQKMSPLEEVVSPHTATSCGVSTSKVEVIDKVACRRMKNNVASKRSREQRKAKFVEMDKEADFLTEENDRLRQKIVELEQKAKEMKALLVAKMAGKA